jgi:hypothetical protein
LVFSPQILYIGFWQYFFYEPFVTKVNIHFLNQRKLRILDHGCNVTNCLHA